MDDRDNPIDSWLSKKLVAYLAGLMGLGWVALFATYPTIWAVVTGVLFVLAFGLLTARIVFRVEGAKRTVVWTLVCGLAWLLLFYLLWLLRKGGM